MLLNVKILFQKKLDLNLDQIMIEISRLKISLSWKSVKY